MGGGVCEPDHDVLEGDAEMILLTAQDGSLVTVALSNIRNIAPSMGGAIVFLEKGDPLRVMQSADRVMSRWKRSPI